MSRYPFTGPNYAQYGEVAGYIYYPWNDQYYIDPNMVQAYNESVGLAEPAPKEPSYWDMLMPVAGTAAALYGGKVIGEKLASGELPNWLKFGNDQVAQQTGQQVASQVGTEQLATTVPWDQMGSAGVEQLSTAVPSNMWASQAANPNALSVFGTPLAGSGEVTSLGTNTWGNFGSGGTAPMIADTAGVAVAAHNMMDAFGNLQGDRKGVTEGLATTAGTTVGAIFGGPIGAGVGSVVGRTAGRGLNSLLKGAGVGGWRKETEEYQKERWQNLLDKGVVGVDQAMAVKQQQKENPIADPAWEGQSWTFEKANEMVKKDGLGFLLDVGNFEAFPDWMTGYTHEQRIEISKRLANEGLYHSEKGSVLIKDKDKANLIAQGVRSGELPITTSMPQSAANQGAPPPPPPTSSTAAPTQLNEKTLVAEGQKQMQMGNMRPAGMIPNQQQQGGQQPMQGYKPTPQQIGQMQVPQQQMQPQGMIPTVQPQQPMGYQSFLASRPANYWEDKSQNMSEAAKPMFGMLQGFGGQNALNQNEYMSYLMGTMRQQQPQQPQGRIPAPAPQAPVQPTVQPTAPPPQQLGRRAGYRWDPYLNQYVEL